MSAASDDDSADTAGDTKGPDAAARDAAAASTPRLLVIEDGTEYEEFARLFLGERFEIVPAHDAEEALTAARAAPFAAMLVDLRFERSESEDLLGDVTAAARRMFGGDTQRALRWLKDQQGTLILAELRKAGFAQPAVFVHDFAPERLANLRKLYGAVHAVPTFDAIAIRAALGAGGTR